MRRRRSSVDRSFGLRVGAFLRGLPEATVGAALDEYGKRHGAGSAAYVRRCIRRQTGAVPRPESTIEEFWPDLDGRLQPTERLALLSLLRQARLRATERQEFVLGIDDIAHAKRLVEDAVVTEPDLLFPPERLAPSPEAAATYESLRRSERVALRARRADFFALADTIATTMRELPPHARASLVWDSARYRIEVRLRGGDMQHEEPLPPTEGDEHLLARWTDAELESRFKAGDVSYPEYVLRNMDTFFTAEERGELHKLAATQGLELERQLMEIQIKSRTSEADVKKLVETIRTLKEKGVRADVVSRHETPSGHIEIVARTSPWKLGCLPWIISGVSFVLSCVVAFA